MQKAEYLETVQPLLTASLDTFPAVTKTLTGLPARISLDKHSSIKCNHLLKTIILPPSNILIQDGNMVAKQHRLAY